VTPPAVTTQPEKRFATALATRDSHTAFLVGVAAAGVAIGASRFGLGHTGG
jgi:hypothetical protein